MVSKKVIFYLKNKISEIDERGEDVELIIRALRRYVKDKGIRKNFFQNIDSPACGALERILEQDFFIKDNSRICSYHGWGGTFRGDERAYGFNAGKYAKFYDNSEARGNRAGERSSFYNNSKASGRRAGRRSRFHNCSYVLGGEAGKKAVFYHHSYHAGINSGKGAINHNRFPN